MAEITVEYLGAGFVHPYPGEFANCQVVFDEDTKEVLRVEPLGTPPVAPIEQASSAVTEASTDNQGG